MSAYLQDQQELKWIEQTACTVKEDVHFRGRNIRDFWNEQNLHHEEFFFSYVSYGNVHDAGLFIFSGVTSVL